MNACIHSHVCVYQLFKHVWRLLTLNPVVPCTISMPVTFEPLSPNPQTLKSLHLTPILVNPYPCNPLFNLHFFFFFFTQIETVSLVSCCFAMYGMLGPLKSTYEEKYDKFGSLHIPNEFGALYCIVPCAVMALFFHP